jgi:hypothetical protein
VASELREHIRSQVFGILCAESEDPNFWRQVKVGSNNGLVTQPGTQFPAFIAPPNSIAMTLEMRLAGIVAEIYRAAGLEQPQGEQSAVEKSGVARAYDFLTTNRRLSGFARNAEAFEEAIGELVLAWDGSAGTVSVTYPTDFDVESLEQEIAEAFAVLDKAAELPPVIVRDARLRLAQLVDRQASEADQTTAREQIELRYAADLKRYEAQYAPQEVPPASIPITALTSFTLPSFSLNEIRSAVGAPPVPGGDMIPALAAAQPAPEQTIEEAVAEAEAAMPAPEGTETVPVPVT